MSGRNAQQGPDAWSFNNNHENNKTEMRTAVAQLDKYFNISNRPFMSSSSNDSSRSGSFCSDADSLPSSSPPRDSFSPEQSRVPLFNRFAFTLQADETHVVACFSVCCL